MERTTEGTNAAIVDSNVVLSGFLRERSPPGRLLAAWRQVRFVMLTSATILDEIRWNLGNYFFHEQMTRAEMDENLALLHNEATLVVPTIMVHGVATHPKDDLILSAAVSADADYLVTGDRQLLALGQCGGIPIVSPSIFLDILNAYEAL